MDISDEVRNLLRQSEAMRSRWSAGLTPSKPTSKQTQPSPVTTAADAAHIIAKDAAIVSTRSAVDDGQPSTFALAGVSSDSVEAWVHAYGSVIPEIRVGSFPTGMDTNEDTESVTSHSSSSSGGMGAAALVDSKHGAPTSRQVSRRPTEMFSDSTEKSMKTGQATPRELQAPTEGHITRQRSPRPTQRTFVEASATDTGISSDDTTGGPSVTISSKPGVHNSYGRGRAPSPSEAAVRPQTPTVDNYEGIADRFVVSCSSLDSSCTASPPTQSLAGPTHHTKATTSTHKPKNKSAGDEGVPSSRSPTPGGERAFGNTPMKSAPRVDPVASLLDECRQAVETTRLQLVTRYGSPAPSPRRGQSPSIRRSRDHRHGRSSHHRQIGGSRETSSQRGNELAGASAEYEIPLAAAPLEAAPTPSTEHGDLQPRPRELDSSPTQRPHLPRAASTDSSVSLLEKSPNATFSELPQGSAANSPSRRLSDGSELLLCNALDESGSGGGMHSSVRQHQQQGEVSIHEPLSASTIRRRQQLPQSVAPAIQLTSHLSPLPQQHVHHEANKNCGEGYHSVPTSEKDLKLKPSQAEPARDFTVPANSGRSLDDLDDFEKDFYCEDNSSAEPLIPSTADPVFHQPPPVTSRVVGGPSKNSPISPRLPSPRTGGTESLANEYQLNSCNASMASPSTVAVLAATAAAEVAAGGGGLFNSMGSNEGSFTPFKIEDVLPPLSGGDYNNSRAGRSTSATNTGPDTHALFTSGEYSDQHSTTHFIGAVPSFRQSVTTDPNSVSPPPSPSFLANSRNYEQPKPSFAQYTEEGQSALKTVVPPPSSGGDVEAPSWSVRLQPTFRPAAETLPIGVDAASVNGNNRASPHRRAIDHTVEGSDEQDITPSGAALHPGVRPPRSPGRRHNSSTSSTSPKRLPSPQQLSATGSEYSIPSPVALPQRSGYPTTALILPTSPVTYRSASSPRKANNSDTPSHEKSKLRKQWKQKRLAELYLMQIMVELARVSGLEVASRLDLSREEEESRTALIRGTTAGWSSPGDARAYMLSNLL